MKNYFAVPLGIQTTIYSEILSFIHAVELSMINNWFPLCIETNSALLVGKVISHSIDVPWQLRVRW